MLRIILESSYIISLTYLIYFYYKLFKNVVFLRRQLKISIGSNNKKLERAIRAHSNFCETVPFICLISFFLYFNNLLFFCVPMLILLAIGRTIHGKAVSSINEKIEHRRIGMRLTIYSLFIGLGGLFYYLAQLIYFSIKAYKNTTFLPQII